MRWLRELAVFDFDIKYQTGKLNQEVGTLSHHPLTNYENPSDAESEEYETVLYTVVCDDLTSIIKDIKLPWNVRHRIQGGSSHI